MKVWVVQEVDSGFTAVFDNISEFDTFMFECNSNTDFDFITFMGVLNPLFNDVFTKEVKESWRLK